MAKAKQLPSVGEYLIEALRGHGVDHMFLLIFAAAVGSIAADFGFANWADLMPYGAGAFVIFGLGAVPAGRLGDLWGRRGMMIVFFVGTGRNTHEDSTVGDCENHGHHAQ